ncbi:MAG: hypothetical protein ACJ72Z_02830 [Pyrinomonadaceae bacterium]
MPEPLSTSRRPVLPFPTARIQPDPQKNRSPDRVPIRSLGECIISKKECIKRFYIVVSAGRFFFFTLLFALTLASCNVRDTPMFKWLAESNDEEITRQTEELIRTDPEMGRLNEICMSIPMPKDTILVRKGGPDDRKKSLWVLFNTSTSFEQLDRTWSSHFERNNWRLAGNETTSIMKLLEYRKENMTIQIQFGGLGSKANVSLGCM